MGKEKRFLKEIETMASGGAVAAKALGYRGVTIGSKGHRYGSANIPKLRLAARSLAELLSERFTDEHWQDLEALYGWESDNALMGNEFGSSIYTHWSWTAAVVSAVATSAHPAGVPRGLVEWLWKMAYFHGLIAIDEDVSVLGARGQAIWSGRTRVQLAGERSNPSVAQRMLTSRVYDLVMGSGTFVPTGWLGAEDNWSRRVFAGLERLVPESLERVRELSRWVADESQGSLKPLSTIRSLTPYGLLVRHANGSKPKQVATWVMRMTNFNTAPLLAVVASREAVIAAYPYTARERKPRKGESFWSEYMHSDFITSVGRGAWRSQDTQSSVVWRRSSEAESGGFLAMSEGGPFEVSQINEGEDRLIKALVSGHYPSLLTAEATGADAVMLEGLAEFYSAQNDGGEKGEQGSAGEGEPPNHLAVLRRGVEALAQEPFPLQGEKARWRSREACAKHMNRVIDKLKEDQG